MSHDSSTEETVQFFAQLNEQLEREVNYHYFDAPKKFR